MVTGQSNFYFQSPHHSRSILKMSILSFVVTMTLMVYVCQGFQSPLMNIKLSPQRMSMASEQDPLLLRAARGEVVESVPVWMMRQAGRHIKVCPDELFDKFLVLFAASQNLTKR